MSGGFPTQCTAAVTNAIHVRLPNLRTPALAISSSSDGKSLTTPSPPSTPGGFKPPTLPPFFVSPPARDVTQEIVLPVSVSFERLENPSETKVVGAKANQQPEQNNNMRRRTAPQRQPRHFLWSDDHIISSRLGMLGRKRHR
jgi:hypothetical protein